MSSIIISLNKEDIGEILFGNGLTIPTSVKKYDNLQDIVIKYDGRFKTNVETKGEEDD